jgi:hypothetical protein
MNNLEHPRWGTAVHEAGHVVANVLLGIPFRKVSVQPGGTTEGHVAGYRTPGFWSMVEDAGSEASHGQFVAAPERKAIERRIISTLAGGLAEMHSTGKDDHEVGMDIIKRSTEDVFATTGPVALGEGSKVISGGDYDIALRTALACSGSDEEGTTYFAWLERRTINLLRTPGFFAAVESLARQLLERESLSAREAKQVIADALFRRRERIPDPLVGSSVNQ